MVERWDCFERGLWAGYRSPLKSGRERAFIIIVILLLKTEAGVVGGFAIGFVVPK